MHQNIHNLYSWKSPTCFDPAGPSSGRRVSIHYGCVYTVKCESALGSILRVLPAHTRTVHFTSHTEDGSWGTFTLNCINATTVYRNYSPWTWPSRVETCRRLSRIKIIYIFVYQLVFNISYEDMQHIKSVESTLFGLNFEWFESIHLHLNTRYSSLILRDLTYRNVIPTRITLTGNYSRTGL
jgi:hypothetical protein